MNKTPLATVIVPTYNSPDLCSTLESVLAQDYPQLQLILVDDASDSFSKEDVEAFLLQNGRDNLKLSQVLVNSQNSGTVHTINLALKHTQGEYIFILAGDDCFQDCHVISDWVAAFIKTGAQVMTAYRAIYDDQLHTCLRVEPTPDQVRKIQTKPPHELFEELAAANFIFGCCTARTAESIRRYGFFDERYHLIEDHPMNLKLLRLGEPIVFFDRIVVKYRDGGASTPLRYNAVYEHDVDLILKHDVLPYTKHPLRRRWDCYQWKRDHRLLQRRAQLLTDYSGHRSMSRLIQMWHYLHHPWRTLRKLPARIQKWIKKERGNNGHNQDSVSNPHE